MRKLRLLLLLLLPSLLWAGTVTVKKAEQIPQAAGTVRRTSMAGENYVVDQDSAHFNRGDFKHGTFGVSISAGVVNYKDSLGKWQSYNFDSAPDTVNGFTVVRTGKFDIAYDSTGRIRYQKKDALLTLSPAFNRTNVDINFNINRNGLKANYILKNSSAPSILNWKVTANDTVEEQPGGKGKGALKKASKVMGQIAEFTAKDAAGKTVSLTASYKKDSLIVQLDTAGATWPITLDPSVNDTILDAASGRIKGVAGVSAFTLARDTTKPSEKSIYSAGGGFGSVMTGSASSNYRTALTFPMVSNSNVDVLDSVRLWIKTTGADPAQDTLFTYVAKGTFTGAALDSMWYTQFSGRVVGSAHTFTPLDSTHIPWLVADGAEWKSARLTRAGVDTVANHMGVDSLRLMLMSQHDYTNTSPPGSTELLLVAGVLPYLAIYYTVNLPGVSTIDDTLKAAVNLAGVIDSTGNVNATVRGFKYWPRNAGAGDTLTVSASGSFAAGAFTIYIDSLKADTTYFYKAYATGAGGTSYGAIDSFSSAITGGGTVTVYDTTFIRRGGFGGRFSR